jgi:nicotinamidase-related amidase
MNTALLLMDFQNGIAGRPGFEPVVEAAARALAAARGRGVPVIFVRVAFRPGSADLPGWQRKTSVTTGVNGVFRCRPDALASSHGSLRRLFCPARVERRAQAVRWGIEHGAG